MERIHNLKSLKNIRKKLRKDSTKAEIVLWNILRSKAYGYKFRRQHSIGNYIVDFYCPKLKLILEIDGCIHGEDFKKKKDDEKERFLISKGFTLLRYRNEQVLYEIDSVLQDIENNLP